MRFFCITIPKSPKIDAIFDYLDDLFCLIVLDKREKSKRISRKNCFTLNIANILIWVRSGEFSSCISNHLSLEQPSSYSNKAILTRSLPA